jgi:hypothetical protein
MQHSEPRELKTELPCKSTPHPLVKFSPFSLEERKIIAAF